MTIAKNTNRAKQVIANAHDVRCFSLSNNFSGTLLDRPCVWCGPVVNGRRTDLVRVSDGEFLLYQLNAFRGAKLSVNTDGKYHLTIHSNLWYEFSTHEWTLQADDTRACACGAKREL